MKPKKNVSVIINIITFTIITSFPLQASFKLAQAPYSAKAAGMMYSFTGKSTGPESIFNNFATPPTLQNLYIKLNHETIEENNITSLSIQNIKKLPFLRLGYIYNPNDLSQKNPFTLSKQLTSKQHHAILISVHRKIIQPSIGLKATTVYESQNNLNALSTSLDAGIFQPFKILKKEFNIGITITNILSSPHTWSNNKTELKEKNIKIGIHAIPFSKRLELNSDITIDQNTISPSFGYEYWLSGAPKQANCLVIRSGINSKKASLGASLHLNSFIIDYAVINPLKDIQNTTTITHFLSIGLSKHPFTRTIPRKKTLRYQSENINIKEKKPLKNLIQSIKKNINKSKKPTEKNKKFIISFNIKVKNKQLKFKKDIKNKKWKVKIKKTPYKNKQKNQPFELTCKKNKKKIHLTIETTQDEIQIKGFIPNSISLYINNNKIKKINNKPLSTKIKFTENTPISILIIESN